MELPRVLALIALFAGHSNLIHAQNDEGDSCTYKATGKTGTCKVMLECPSAIEGLRKNIWPQTCSFKGTAPIVCCENAIGGNDDGPSKSPVGLKSKQKCDEYAKYVNITYVSPVLSLAKHPNITRDECGFKIVKLIVGGEKADSREFPHMVAIGYDSPTEGRVYHCGGSLISENYILTAGHCAFSRENGEAKYARVGDLNLKLDLDDEEPQEYKIAQIIRHPDYRPPSQYNDIALMRLEQNVRFTAYVRPICLTSEMEPTTASAIATGWGKTGSFEGGSDHLLKVKLEFFSQEECSPAFEPNARKLQHGINATSQICAGSRQGKLKDTCPGDSGGPLQIYNVDVYCMYKLIGITSFGKICGATHSPAVYTRVAHYVDWIERTVWT